MRTNKFVKVACICSSIIVFIIIAIVTTIPFLTTTIPFLTKKIDSSISPQIDLLFAAIENNTFGDTYLTETAPEFRHKFSIETYKEIGQTFKSQLGRLKSKSLDRYEIGQTNGQTLVDVVYSASFEKEQGTIRAQFRLVKGKWLLRELRVNW